MHNLLSQQLDQLLHHCRTRSERHSESALRVGAATLARGISSGISATTVVADPGGDDPEAFFLLVAEIARDYGLDARIEPRGGAYAVRLTRPLPAPC